jgi:hypothetical protein
MSQNLTLDSDGDGIPYITVVVNVTWSKRSYKSNYNSLSGMGCIIGDRITLCIKLKSHGRSNLIFLKRVFFCGFSNVTHAYIILVGTL